MTDSRHSAPADAAVSSPSILDRRRLLGGMIGAGFLATAGCTGTAGRAIAAQTIAPTDDFPGLRRTITGYVRERKVAGMLAAIGFGQDAPTVIAAGTQSLDGDRPVDLDTLWRLYSQTKPMTGIATMMLIEDGKLGIDQPLSDILPEFAEQRVLLTPGGALDRTEPARNAITIRHLLTHTAGLGYSIVSQGPIRDAYLAQGLSPGRVTRLPIPPFNAGAPTPDAREFTRRLAKLPLVYQPGTQWSYSIGLDVLSAVIAEVGGMPLDRFLQQRLFGPLGMDDIFYRVPDDRIADFADNYAVFSGTLLPIDPAETSIYRDPPAFAFGGSGLVGSARDYDTFLKMLLGFGATGGVRVMSEATARTAMSNLLPQSANTKGTWVAAHGFGAGGRVGLGTAESPAGTFGWGGAAGTAAFVDTARGFRAGGYTQYMPSNSYGFQAEFPAMVYADLTGRNDVAGQTS